MNIKALITTLVLGSSSVAMARPVAPVTVQAHAELTIRPTAPVIRDHRYPVRTLPVRTQPTRRPTWNGGYNHGGYQHSTPLSLGTNLHFAGDGRTFIPVGMDKGRFTTVRIDGYSGQSLINQVAIEFEQGQVQVVRNLNRVIDGNRPLMIDLDGNARRIVRIVVYGQAQYPYGNNYRIMAPSFSVSAL